MRPSWPLALLLSGLCPVAAARAAADAAATPAPPAAFAVPAAAPGPPAPVSADAATDPDAGLLAPAPDGDSLAAARLSVAAGSPTGRYAHTAILDPERQRMMMFGGSTFAISNELWALRLQGAAEWFVEPPGAAPAPRRAGHVAIHDPGRHRMLVFGGVDGARQNDVWEFPLGPGGTWSRLTVAGTPPAPRSLTSAVYDPVRERMIVFGGYRDNAYLNDVWALSLSGTPTWTELVPQGSGPSIRREHSAIYDPRRDRMIVFGGTSGPHFGDLYELRLAGTPTWAPLFPGGTAPSGRAGHSAVYDALRDEMWVFGGRTSASQLPLNELWSLSLSGTPAWQPRAAQGTLPVGRAFHSAILDPAGDRMVVFAGYTAGLANDTWFLQLAGGPTWYLLGSEPPVPLTTPDPRFTIPVSLSATTIELGQVFTVVTSVVNDGLTSDDGRISISFPGLTDPADGQWVSSAAGGDSPGYIEYPAGFTLYDASCQPRTASYLTVEYQDDDWQGLGTEVNAFTVQVQPRTGGTFYVDVRSTMHRAGGACEWVNDVPPNGTAGNSDQQGWAVRRFAITVLDAPDPTFVGNITLSATTVELGLTFTLTATVRNDGANTDDGRISISFPAFADPGDGQWVSSSSSGDSPGYVESPAGSTLSDASCQPVTAGYLVAEYVDDAWSGPGSETNTLSVTVRPQASGTFYVYLRSTMRKVGGEPCVWINDLPSDGTGGYVDQQGFAVKRFSVTVGPPPPPPAPAFTLWQLSATTITLGEQISLNVRVVNNGGQSDDGRVVFSFPIPSTVSLGGGQTFPAGSSLLDANCQPVTITYPVVEQKDTEWFPGEVSNLWIYMTPTTAGTFYFDVRSTMHAVGTACDYVNALPATGTAGFTDEQGWPVKRHYVTVRTNAPSPVFPSPVTGLPASITLGSSFTFNVIARNDGTASPDGRLIVAFPQLIEAGDATWVSNSTAGDAPGYREYAAGGAHSSPTCQGVVSPYLVVEYADNNWGGYNTSGSDQNEQNAMVLTVTPQMVGDFLIDIRATMRQATISCVWINGLPLDGEGGHTDPQGWPVKRFRVQVSPPPATTPKPVFVTPVELSASAITLGESVTLRARVRNDGTDSDQGVIQVSFPALTDPGDDQWVTHLGTGDDVPGYRALPAGSLLADAACALEGASYLAVEYSDSDWDGVFSGHERNELLISIRPPVAGTFYVYVRSAMRETGATCVYRTGLPANGAAGYTDQRGWAVKRFTITVSEPVTGPRPFFLTGPSGFPSSITLGQSFTFSLTVRNDGLASDGGRISVAFPALTDPGDAQWASSPSGGDDLPGYREMPAGTPITAADCRTVSAAYLVTEYGDDAWGAGEANALDVTVQPQATGSFYVDIRSTMHRTGAPPCDDVSAVPAGGFGSALDQQGWTVTRYQVLVYPSVVPGLPTTRWTQLYPAGTGPTVRAGSAAVYHRNRISMILYGGGAGTYHSDVWELTLGAAPAWNRLLPGGPSPLPRILHSMIHNPVDDQLVIFGGYYDNPMNDIIVLAFRPVLWWFKMAPQGPQPTARIGHAAVHDPVRHRMLVIGGFDGAMRSDVWSYALPGNGAWTRLEPTGGPPPGRAQHAAIYDPIRDRVLVFGGDGGVFMNDVWELRLTTPPAWSQLVPVTAPPGGRREHAAIYDAGRDRLVTFGGFDGTRRDDVWALTLAGPPIWEPLTSETEPPAGRAQHAAVYDPIGQTMVVFGGEVGPNQFQNDVWALSLELPTPALASLVALDVTHERVRLTWAVEGAAELRARVDRSAGASADWTALGSPAVEGDRLVFVDRDVTPGGRYGYRLTVRDAVEETVLEPVWVTVPVRAGLSLAGASPNPASGDLHVAFSLPAGGEAVLELYDLRGRLLARREVGSLGAGEHRVTLADGRRLDAGVYLVRLTRSGRVLTAKACVVR